MRLVIQRFLRDQRGATAIEYALICGIVFLGIVASIHTYTDSMTVMYDKIATAMQKATGG